MVEKKYRFVMIQPYILENVEDLKSSHLALFIANVTEYVEGFRLQQFVKIFHSAAGSVNLPLVYLSRK